DPRWPNPSAQWLHQAETLAALDARLPQLLKGEAQPADAAERIQLGWLCQQRYKQFNAAAAHYYAEAFATEPKLGENLDAQHRYDAACAAALAGCGTGKDADNLDDQQRAHLRQQALTWLRADLTAWRLHLDKDPENVGPEVLRQMRHWQG